MTKKEIKEVEYRAKGKNLKYIAVFILRAGKSFELLGKKQFRPDKNIVSYKGTKAYIINTEIETYSRGTHKFFFIELNEGQIPLGKGNVSISPEVANIVLKEQGIRQLAFSMMGRIKGVLMDKITMLAIGGLIGFIIGFFTGG